MADQITLTSRFGKFITIVTAAIVCTGIAGFVVAGDTDELVRYLAPLLLIAYSAWLMFWKPRVIVDDSGVTLVNVLRTIHVPWPAIQRIDTQWALTLDTAYGRFTAWAAPAPGRHRGSQTPSIELRRLPESTYNAGAIRPGDLPRTASGEAAEIIRRRWEELRDAGHLDEPRLEDGATPARWRWREVAVVGVLVAATVVSAVVG